MNRHILFDRAMLWAINRFGDPFFSASTESPPFEEHLERLRLDPLDIGGAGLCEIGAHTLAGTIEERVNVLHYLGPDAPLLVYNMGGGESPFDKTMQRTYPPSAKPPFSVVAVEAPYQRTLGQLKASFAHLNTYLAMIATAVKTTETILQQDAFAGSAAKVVAGASLGGFVSNRHHMVYDSADAYVPFVAGTRHGEIFLSTVPAAPAARAQPEYLRERLNFDAAWFERSHPNVFPQLGRYDQLNRLEIQGPSYGDMEIDIWDGGHLYNYYHPELMREKFRQVFTLLGAT